MDDLVAGFLARLGWASVYLAAAGTLAWGVVRLLRIESPSIHGAIWWVVLLHGLLLSQVTLAIPWYEPSEPVVLVAEQDPVLWMPAETVNEVAAERTLPAPVVGTNPEPVAPFVEKPAAIPWSIMIGLVWLGGIVLIPVRWSWDYVSFLRACRSRPCDRRDWAEEWGAVLREVGVKTTIPIHLGFGVGPALCRHPTGFRLIVPVRLWRRLTAEQRRCVLRHELAHYRRGDVWRLLVARLLALPHWFNPVAWHGVRAIELAAEYACDDVASESECKTTTDYARTLLTMGELVHRPPAWTTAGGGGCLFKRISRVLSNSEVEDSAMKKTLVLVVLFVVTFASVVRVELVAQEATRHVTESEPATAPAAAGTASTVARIRELAKPAIPFEEIEAIAAKAAGSDDAGPIYAEVASAFHNHGSLPRTVFWAQAALRQPLEPLDRLRMFRYWGEASDRLFRERESNNGGSRPPSVLLPALAGLVEASHYRIPVEGFRAARVPSARTDANWIRDFGNELVDVRNALVRVIARGSSNAELELKRFLLSEGFIEGAAGGEETPPWLSEGRAAACTFLIDYPKLSKDLPPVFDAFVGEEGAFEDVKEGLAWDKHGPHVDLEHELIPYLGQRTTLVTDYREPSLGQGEQFLYAIEVTDSRQVAEVCDRLCAADSDSYQITEGEVKIWVFEARDGRPTKQGLCVAHGCLMVGDFDLLCETLSQFE